MAFASNYWHITASYVQGNAQQKALSQPPQPLVGAGAQSSFVPEIQHSVTEVPTLLPGSNLQLYPQKKWIEPPAPAEASSPLNRQAMQVWQMSPNLTMDQLKAILRVNQFDQI